MPTRPKINSNLLPSCTCRLSIKSNPIPTRKNLATLSIPNSTTSEPFLDFLYPTFGFFSRSLPPIQTLPLINLLPRFTPRFSSSSGSSSSGSSTLNIKVGVRSSWKRNSSLENKCICGRAQHSCLRCRSTSSSSRVGIEAVSLNEGKVMGSESFQDILIEKGKSIDSPKPLPPPPLIIINIKQKSLNSKLIQLRRQFTKSDKELPSVRGQLTTWSLDRVRNTRDEILSALQPFKEESVVKEISFTFQLDLIRLFARLAKVLPVNNKSSALVDAYRIELGELMQEFLNFFPVSRGSEHVKSLASLRINALALQNKLPSIVSPSRASDDIFFQDLRIIFQPSNEDSLTPESQKRILQAQRSTLSILLDAWSTTEDGPIEAVKFVAGWEVTSILSQVGEEDSKYQRLAFNLNKQYINLITRIKPSPWIWFAEYSQSPEADKRIGFHLIPYLSNRTTIIDALAIWDSLKGRNSQLHDLQNLGTPALIEGLLDCNYLQDAQRVANYLDNILENLTTAGLAKDNNSNFIESYRVLAKLAAAQGRPEKTFELLSNLESIGWETGLEGVARQMRAATQAKELEVAKAHFKSAIFEGTTTFDQTRLWGELIRAHIRLGDLRGGMIALRDMLAIKLLPNRALVTTLLYGHVNLGDLERTYELFNKLPELKIVPNVVTYTALTTLHAKRRDPESVERVIEEMKSLGIEPDLITWTSFMDSLVEVGQFPAAIKIFDFLQTNKDPALHPDTAARNVILKAGTLAGAPPLSLLSLLNDGVEKGFRPNFQTYTLLMHVLCTSGCIEAAEALYVYMKNANLEDAVLPISSDRIKPDVFIYSTMIYGYLKRGTLRTDKGESDLGRKIHAEDLQKARAVLSKMRSENIQPTNVTIGIIIEAFIKEEGIRGLQKAEDSAKAFLQSYSTLPTMIRNTSRPYSKRDVYSVFGPIINAHAKNLNPDAALEYFTTILAADSEPSILQHTSLMDAYKRVGDLNGVRVVWRRLYSSVMNRYGREVNILPNSLPQLSSPQSIEPFSSINSESSTFSTSTSTSTSTSSTSIPSTSTPNSDSTIITPNVSLPHTSIALINPPSIIQSSSSPDIPKLSTLPVPDIKIDFYHRNILCLPLSILIDALASNDTYRELIRVWQQLAKEGFSFDAGNWNSLALAFCRKGDYVTAFEIAERILCGAEDGQLDPDSILFEFGGLNKPENVVRNPARLFQLRRKEKQNVNTISAGNLRGLMGDQSKYSYVDKAVVNETETKEAENKEVSTGETLSKYLVESSKKRQNQYWFIHTSLVVDLDKVLRLLGRRNSQQILGEEFEVYETRIREEAELREKLIRDHPKTIRRIRFRMNELERKG